MFRHPAGIMGAKCSHCSNTLYGHIPLQSR